MSKSIEAEIREELFVKNEYGVSHAKPDEVNSPNFSLKATEWLKSKGMETEYTYPSGAKVPIHRMCIGCQARHILKYDGHPLAGDEPFQVQCKGVPAAYPPGTKATIKRMATEKNMSEERALQLVQSSMDPASWAEMMFGFNDKTKGDDDEFYLRWYQKEQLRCSAKRMVIREGRRTGKTFVMALKILHLAFNMQVQKGLNSEGNPVVSGPSIVVVTPFSAQLVNFFNEMEKLLKRNVDLVKEVTTDHAGSLYVKTPYFRMEFANGGSISGFVTGVEIRQDGSSAGALRGQSASVIYLDEMDMIQPDVLDKVILPILITSRHTVFYATSTPIGKAGAFHNLCFNKPDFVETYLPSTVLPHWEDAKKDIGNTDPTDDAFVSEYMAQFIESTSSVFKTDLVINAMRNFTYEDSDIDNASWWNNFAGVKSRSDLMKIIGIDWNKNAGSEFFVICYDPKQHIWWCAEALNVSPTQHNSIRFKEEVKRLNAKWKPDWIYADEGYGHHIIDDLLWEANGLLGAKGLTNLQAQTAELTKRLKTFNFSQKVELRNPVDNTIITRTGKEFLVENTIRVFEQNRIFFPSNDNTLRSQMQNYIILRRHASTGRPVYGMRTEKVGDHRLDAMMLALGGLFLENNPLYSVNARTLGESATLVKREQMIHEIDDQIEAGHLGVVGGLKLQEIKYIRGEPVDEEKIEKSLKRQQAANAPTIPAAIPTSRSEFPTGSKPKSSGSMLETLFKKKSTDNNPLARSKRETPISEFYVTKKKRHSSRGFR